MLVPSHPNPRAKHEVNDMYIHQTLRHTKINQYLEDFKIHFENDIQKIRIC